MNKGFWDEAIKKYKALDKNIKTDVLVVGGGLAGVLTAYRLAIKGYSVVLVEKDELGSHRTIKTTAVITALQDVYYSDLCKNIGDNKTKLFLEANMSAIEEYKKLSLEYSFDFEEVNSYKYSNDLKKLNDEIKTLTKLGYEANLVNFKFNMLNIDAIEFKNQGQMNPMKLIDELTSTFHVYEHSMVHKIKDNMAFIGDYYIEANKIIITTGYPFFRWRGGFFMKLTQRKSYVLAIKTDDKSMHNGVGGNDKDLYFRSYKDYLLVGGNDTNSGKRDGGFNKIEDYARMYYPNSIVENRWINQDTVSLDGMPYIGKLRYLNDVYVATGFNLWGMTGAMISSMVIANSVCGIKNPYQKLFSIYRRMLFMPLLKNIGKAIVGLVTPKTLRCSHMGCVLVWNNKELCYECPCHGSRYDYDGKVIENPAMSDKKIIRN
ncbi:MAG: FAD-dependent oxidoreductase [Anaeroplasmataceae bacterium]